MKALPLILISSLGLLANLRAENSSIISTDGEFQYSDAIIKVESNDHSRKIKIKVTSADGNTILDSTIEGSITKPFLVYWDSSQSRIWWATEDIIKTYHFTASGLAGSRYSLEEGIKKLHPPNRFTESVRTTFR